MGRREVGPVTKRAIVMREKIREFILESKEVRVLKKKGCIVKARMLSARDTRTDSCSSKEKIVCVYVHVTSSCLDIRGSKEVGW